MVALKWLCPCTDWSFGVSVINSIPVVFDCRLDKREGKWDKQAEDQPDIEHLHVRRGRQLGNLGREDGGHHQHDGQVHCEARLKVLCLEEGGGIADAEQEQGGQ